MSEHLDEIKRRGVSPYQVLFASMLATMREYRILSYVTVCGIMSDVGKRLAGIYGREDGLAGTLRRIAELLEVGEFEVAENPEGVTFAIKTSTCRICPRGVGGLTLPEKLCPLVGLLAGYAGIDYRPDDHRREGGYCIIEFKRPPNGSSS
ncbi:MAG: hypothetical protein QW394_07235 [Thermofilaceae archaeon]